MSGSLRLNFAIFSLKTDQTIIKTLLSDVSVDFWHVDLRGENLEGSRSVTLESIKGYFIWK